MDVERRRIAQSCLNVEAAIGRTNIGHARKQEYLQYNACGIDDEPPPLLPPLMTRKMIDLNDFYLAEQTVPFLSRHI